MSQAETPLKPSVLLLLRNLAGGTICGVGGYYMVQTSQIVIVILGGCMLLAAPFLLLMPLFMGLPGRGPCPQCGGTIETMAGKDWNLMCRGCGLYLDAGQGKLRPSDPNRVEAEPQFCAPGPWADITGVLFPTIAFSADDAIRDMLTTKKGGVRMMEASWPRSCVVCGSPPTRFDEMARKIILPGRGTGWGRDTGITVAAKGVPYCDAHKDGVMFDRVHSANATASPGFGLKFRSLAYRNAFMRANPWPFTWHE